MIPVKLARTLQQEDMGCIGTYAILLDEQKRRALPLWFSRYSDQIGEIPVHTSLQKDLANLRKAQLLTTDFIAKVLDTSEGTIEEISIDFLYGDRLFAHIRLRDQHRLLHTLQARLDDALSLAVRLKSPLTVAEEVLERLGINLMEAQTPLEQQLEAIAHTLQTNPDLLCLRKGPRDFTDGLRGWMFVGDPEFCNYWLDTQTTYTGKASLAISLRERLLDETQSIAPSAVLGYEGVLAERYRGKRLLMVIYIKAEQVEQANLILTVSGPPIAPEQSSYAYATDMSDNPIEGTCDWTRRELVIDIPDDALVISYQLQIQGACKIWLDGIRFEVVDKSVPLTGNKMISPLHMPQNLDFRQGLACWQLVGSGRQDYCCGVDTVVTSQGTPAAFLRATVAQPRGQGILEQSILADHYRGKQVRLSAYVSTHDVELQAGLFLRAEDHIEQTVSGTAGWTGYELTVQVPDRWSTLHFGISLHGQGQVWLKNVQLEAIEA
ncbi:MAG: bifunctional nuclease family protein [Ktedonobacteraceae bacterium]|nr:bifunctional nuclease family protein [Ktedonobacteraceae bacterium]